MCFDYDESKILSQGDKMGKKLKYIENFEQDVIDYFQSLNDLLNKENFFRIEICFREILEDIVVEFAFWFDYNGRAHQKEIIYLTNADEFGWSEHIEGNWYVYEWVHGGGILPEELSNE